MFSSPSSKTTVGRSEGHLTTRRGFVTTMGFGVVSLYGLWAAYGAAPTSLAFMSGAEGENMKGLGHGGHGGSGGMSPDEFRRLAEAFFDANQLPDGSVKPAHHAMETRPIPESGEHGHGGARDDQHGDSNASMAESRGHGHGGGQEDHEAGPRSSGAEQHGPAHEDDPVDVYMVASRYGYEPELLRLEANVPYRFRIMAVDADHGASIHFRIASRMIRCRAKTLTELNLTFLEPGRYMAYCTVFCGMGHDAMKSTIVVA